MQQDSKQIIKGLPRRILLMLLDCGLIVFCYWLAVMLRFDSGEAYQRAEVLRAMAPMLYYALPIYMIVFWFGGLRTPGADRRAVAHRARRGGGGHCGDARAAGCRGAGRAALRAARAPHRGHRADRHSAFFAFLLLDRAPARARRGAGAANRKKSVNTSLNALYTAGDLW